jgi:hypothetical protein
MLFQQPVAVSRYWKREAAHNNLAPTTGLRTSRYNSSACTTGYRMRICGSPVTVTHVGLVFTRRVSTRSLDRESHFVRGLSVEKSVRAFEVTGECRETAINNECALMDLVAVPWM